MFTHGVFTRDCARRAYASMTSSVAFYSDHGGGVFSFLFIQYDIAVHMRSCDPERK